MSYTLDWLRDCSKINSNDLAVNEKKGSSTMKEICYPGVNFYKICFLFILWNCLSMNYVGVSLGVTSVLKVNPYLMFSLAAFFEFLGAVICLINRK